MAYIPGPLKTFQLRGQGSYQCLWQHYTEVDESKNCWRDPRRIKGVVHDSIARQAMARNPRNIKIPTLVQDFLPSTTWSWKGQHDMASHPWKRASRVERQCWRLLGMRCVCGGGASCSSFWKYSPCQGYQRMSYLPRLVIP